MALSNSLKYSLPGNLSMSTMHSHTLDAVVNVMESKTANGPAKQPMSNMALSTRSMDAPPSTTIAAAVAYQLPAMRFSTNPGPSPTTIGTFFMASTKQFPQKQATPRNPASDTCQQRKKHGRNQHTTKLH
eukprot:m.125352 g.125352  ORF g.125352 m.125352 type:complete len:130 (+) comp15615_c0_seq2:822-1211(+)